MPQILTTETTEDTQRNTEDFFLNPTIELMCKANAAILNAKPMLHKVQLQSVLPAGRNRHYVMEVPKSIAARRTRLCALQLTRKRD